MTVSRKGRALPRLSRLSAPASCTPGNAAKSGRATHIRRGYSVLLHPVPLQRPRRQARLSGGRAKGGPRQWPTAPRRLEQQGGTSRFHFSFCFLLQMVKLSEKQYLFTVLRALAHKRDYAEVRRRRRTRLMYKCSCKGPWSLPILPPRRLTASTRSRPCSAPPSCSPRLERRAWSGFSSRQTLPWTCVGWTCVCGGAEKKKRQTTMLRLMPHPIHDVVHR